MSSAVIVFAHVIHKHSRKVPRTKVVHLGSLGPIPMIQLPFIALVLLYNVRLERSFPLSGSEVTRH